MSIRTSEIADGIFQFSTYVKEIAPPMGFTFNQYLIKADEPLLFHTGQRHSFADLAAAVGRVVPVESLKWISFGHVESDECGAMNQWLAAAQQATVLHGMTACMVSLNDLADRPPRPLADGETVELGADKRVQWIDTPHVPHAWESGLLWEASTATLFCGDLFTHMGDVPSLQEQSIVEAAIQAENMFKASALTPQTGATIRRLAAFRPQTLAVMHGACFRGDCAGQLNQLADYYDAALKAA